MAGVAGSELAAAVARAGGLGFLGSGTMSAEKIQSEYRAAVEAAGSHKSNGVIGIGLLNFCITDEMMAATVACKPHSVWLAVGDFKPFIKPLRQAGIKVMCQVTTMQQITDVVAEGADAIVVQGNESGGHGASPASTLSFVPEAVDHVQQLCKSLNRPGVPVIAAGGISDARQVAACFVLGASGVALGTRLVATTESLYKDSKKQHIVQTGSQASERPTTLRTTLYDELNEDVRWPSGVTARAIRNDFTDQWDGQTPLQSELLDRAKERVKRDAADLTVTSTWAGSSVGLIRSVEPAQSLITHLVKDAAAILKASGQALEDDSLDLGICT
ncbi:hypothetical protein WJX84_010031 [Apatococcus fuscideae]|uniref:Nitronate monooxygenase domain-containing protein n=1 Tax=Apatococcus fuscideae TaxID=2026836 RepID=A0AAW1TA95_9CHLO